MVHWSDFSWAACLLDRASGGSSSLLTAVFKFRPLWQPTTANVLWCQKKMDWVYVKSITIKNIHWTTVQIDFVRAKYTERRLLQPLNYTPISRCDNSCAIIKAHVLVGLSKSLSAVYSHNLSNTDSCAPKHIVNLTTNVTRSKLHWSRQHLLYCGIPYREWLPSW